MGTVTAFPPKVTTVIGRLPLFRPSHLRRSRKLKAKLSDKEDDPLLQSAIFRASLRFQETRHPDPLFVDQYAGCFVSQNIQMDVKEYPHHYCLATKHIDEKLLSSINNTDGPKQVVLFTDGMDTRPYRLSWPISTIIFDISPEIVFRKAAQVLEGVGAKVPRGSLYHHVPWESSEIQQALCSKGFNGNRQSIWALQGLPLMTLQSFEDILTVVSCLAVNGSLFLGEFPACLAGTDIENKSNTERWMDKLFISNGFRVKLINYDEVAKDTGRETVPGRFENILFVAEQLRFSDYQMEIWRREYFRIEEEGDEEGFEEL